MPNKWKFKRKVNNLGKKIKWKRIKIKNNNKGELKGNNKELKN